MSETTKNNPLGTGAGRKHYGEICGAELIAMLVGALYNIVDQLFIGQAVGTLGNAATISRFRFPHPVSR